MTGFAGVEAQRTEKMPLFGRKKQNGDAAEASPKKKKKNELMSSVLHETVIETALDDFHQNKKFQYTEDSYVGIMLDTNDIGGLNKKSNKDGDKGQIIECINSGRMKTLITSQLLEEEKIIFIPDAVTIDAMSEFTVLADAEYTVVLVHDDGSIDVTDIVTDFYTVSDVVEGKGVLGDIIPAPDAEEEEEIDLDTEEVSDESDIDEDDLGYEEMSEDNDDDLGYEEMPEEEDQSRTEVSEESELLDDEYYDEEEYNDEDGFGEEPESEEEPIEEPPIVEEEIETEDITIPEEKSLERIQRKFYSQDLGLEVSMDPFDMQFVQGNDYIGFDENRDDGWLNGYLSQMSRDANTELKKLHQDNLLKMRERYLRVMNIVCDDITQRLDMHNPETQYGQMYQAAMDNRNEARDQADARVQARMDELNEDWQKKMNDVGEEAARDAKNQYRERYQRQHEADLAAVNGQIQDDIDCEYQKELNQIQIGRKDQAMKMLDQGVSGAISECADMYKELLQTESDCYAKHNREMMDYLNMNKAEEVARTKALEEQQRQASEAATVRQEMSAQLTAAQAEYESKKASLQSDIDDMETKNRAYIDELQAAHDRELKKLNDQNDDLQAKIKELTEDLLNRNDIIGKKYEEQLNELKGQNEALNLRCDNLTAMNKRHNGILIALAVLLMIIGISFGFIGGSYFGINQNNEQVMADVEETLNTAATSSNDITSTNH